MLRSLRCLQFLSFELVQECKVWLKLSVFNGIRSFSELLPWIISLIFVGKVGDDDLAAISLAETWLYSFMLVNWIGSEMAQSTLVSQAHGQRSIVAMRGWTVITFVTMSFFNILISALALLYVPVLLGLKFDYDTVTLGANWAYLSIPVLFTEAFVICSSNYLVSSQIYWQPTIVEILRIFVDIPLSYVFIFGCGSEHVGRLENPLVGSALAWLIGSVVSCLLNSALVRYYWDKELEYGHEVEAVVAGKAVAINSDFTASTLNSSLLDSQYAISSDCHMELHFKKAASDNAYSSVEGREMCEDFPDTTMRNVVRWVLSSGRMRSFGHLALPNYLFAFTFCFSYFVLAILAAKLGNSELSAHNLCISLFHVLASVSSGMGEATSVRVGFHVGCNDATRAKRVAAISVVFGALWGSILCITLYSLRHAVVTAMVGSSDVQEQMLKIIPIMATSYVAFAVSDMCLAILEGQGRATEQAVAFSIGSWIVCVPVAFISYFCTDLGLVGIWMASFAGNAVTLVLALYFVSRSNWVKIVADSKERIVETSEEPLEPNHTLKDGVVV